MRVLILQGCWQLPASPRAATTSHSDDAALRSALPPLSGWPCPAFNFQAATFRDFAADVWPLCLEMGCIVGMMFSARS